MFIRICKRLPWALQTNQVLRDHSVLPCWVLNSTKFIGTYLSTLYSTNIL